MAANAVVAGLMSTPVISVGAASLLTNAMGLMADRRIGVMPLVEDGQVVAILTLSDVVTAVARQESM